jgi:HD-GYP domain-containing protein (c-di-GMP phosphodiesterase class II)
VVEGLILGRHDDSRDRIGKTTTMELLVRAGSLEVTRHRIEAGKHFYLDEASDWVGFEFIYVLTGSLTLDEKDTEITLSAGEYLHHHGLSKRAFFRVVEDIDLLMVASPPSSHLVEDEIQEMLALARSVEEKDKATEGHCHRLERFAILTGERLGLSSQRLIDLSYGAYLHDIGKVKVPTEILGKTEALADEEWAEMRQHPAHGEAMLREKDFLLAASTIVRAHHERYDGTGYPDGLRGEEIPIEARVIAVVDAYDAITSERPYQPALAKKRALEELRLGAGTHFDPHVVRAFASVLAEDDDA